MKTYYCVTTTIHDDGRVSVIHSRAQQAEVRPTNKCTSTGHTDYYIDWFDSAEEASEYVRNNQPKTRI